MRLVVDPRVPTAAVTPSGRVLVNPEWFPSLGRHEATFVMAHELMHLCLTQPEEKSRRHERKQDQRRIPNDRTE